ncbi:MAG: HAD family hydrolase [Actinomycetota bacterium]|nr:HAD family hydrolase [Actinomycetota bacterium]
MPVEAVVFDWGGTLTPWHTIHFEDESAALAQAAVEAGVDAADLLRGAGAAVWGRSRDEHRSATLAHIFDEAGLQLDEDRLAPYRSFWDPHTMTDPEVRPLFESLRADGILVGVLSNTVWPRAWHEEIFVRDGVDHLIDGAVYTSEIAWTKPAPEAFRAAMDAVGATDPASCVFVGDRLFDDIYGARSAGMRAIHIPHSDIPAEQLGHTVGEPDAVVHRLAEIPAVIARWR